MIIANASETTTVISADVTTMVSVSETEMTTAVYISTSIKGKLKNYAMNNRLLNALILGPLTTTSQSK